VTFQSLGWRDGAVELLFLLAACASLLTSFLPMFAPLLPPIPAAFAPTLTPLHAGFWGGRLRDRRCGSLLGLSI
jgi:hypothetical protein